MLEISCAQHTHLNSAAAAVAVMKKISASGANAEVGVPVKADASFSVSRALQLQLPKQLAILEEVSEYASREYSLERALDKMQVSYNCMAAFSVSHHSSQAAEKQNVSTTRHAEHSM